MAVVTNIMATAHITVDMTGPQGAMTTTIKAMLGAMQGHQGALNMTKLLKVTTGATPLHQATMVMMKLLKDTIGAASPAMSAKSMSKSGTTTTAATNAVMQMGRLPMVLAPIPPMTIGAIKPSTTQG